MKFAFGLMMVMLMGAQSWAQMSGVPTMQMSAPSRGFSSHGIRVSLIRPTNWGIQSKTTVAGQEALSPEVKVSEVYGASLGYVFLPADRFGFTTGFAFIEASTKGESMQFSRIDGNLAYTWGESLAFKGGINLSHVTKPGVSANDIKWTPSLSYQGGIGLQLTDTFGLDAMYTVMKQKGEYTMNQITDSSSAVGKAEVEFQESGMEVSLHATF